MWMLRHTKDPEIHCCWPTNQLTTVTLAPATLIFYIQNQLTSKKRDVRQIVQILNYKHTTNYRNVLCTRQPQGGSRTASFLVTACKVVIGERQNRFAHSAARISSSKRPPDSSPDSIDHCTVFVCPRR